MTLTITMECDNSAFEDREPEIARILAVLATKIADGRANIDGLPLFDINGNRVGQCRVSH